MKSILLKAVTAVLAVSFLAVSCKKEDDTPTTNPSTNPYSHLYKIGTKAITGKLMTVSLYMDEEPFMGYNHVYAVVVDDVTDEVIENATVQFMPMMDMGAMQHSSPYENPTWNATDKAHKGTVTFIMPSVNGTWTVKVMATNPSSSMSGDVTFDVNVIDKPETRLFSFMDASSNKKVFVALTDPRDPVVGMNDYNVVIYEKQGMMDFPPMTGLKIEIDPEMPTMGHGSPNNVNPTDIGYGHYSGEVNFTMTGYWKVNMVIKDAQDQMMYDQGYFDITFQ